MTSRIVAFTLMSLLATTPALAAETDAHSGILTAIDPVHRTVTLSELGPWTGPTAARTMRTLAIAPDAKIELVQRSKTTSGGWPGGFRESPLAVTQLRPGQFATLRVVHQGGQPTVESIEVVAAANG